MSAMQRLYEIKDLPTLPEVFLRIQELVSSGDYGAATLARLIEQDPAISTKLLNLVNSAFYGPLSKRISSVQLAIARLGMNEVQNAALAASVVKRFSNASDLVDWLGFWRHSLTCAHVAQMLGEIARPALPEEEKQQLFVAGLLHDIGILIYDQFFHREFQMIIDASLRHEKTFYEVEKRLPLKDSHPFVGSALLELWKMNPGVVSAVRYHHRPADSPQGHRRVVYIAHLAEHVVCNWRLGSFEGTLKDLDPSTWTNLGVSSDFATDLMVNAESEVERSDLILALDTPGGGGQLRSV